MPTRRLTRRRVLTRGLGGAMLLHPFIGAGRAMAENAPDTVVYVSNAASKEISVLAMNRDSGELTLIDKIPVPGTDKPSPSSMPMAVTPDRRFLYVTDNGMLWMTDKGDGGNTISIIDVASRKKAGVIDRPSCVSRKSWLSAWSRCACRR